MARKIQNGVNLHVISTTKFKTIRILLRFTALHEKKAAAARTLLTSLLETNSAKYPNQNAISTRLAELYGASFGINIAKKGRSHQVNASMSLVNGKYVDDPNLLKEGFAFLKEVLFYPNIDNQQFNENIFALEKENIEAYLASMSEDKQSYAAFQLQELFFQSNQDQKTPSFGTLADVQSLTNPELVEAYRKMLTEDQVDIFVVGDVNEAEVFEIVQDLPFVEGERNHPELFYEQGTSNIIAEKVLTDNVQQAKLNLGYHHDIYYGDAQRFALMVFNGLFGGFPHSKLFMNVREKASLAYYASSNYDTFRGILTVQTGIDQQNREQVLHLINTQLESLRQGDISETELAQTKTMLKNQYLLSLDSPNVLMDTAYFDTWLPEGKLNEVEFLAGVDSVTIPEIQKVAETLQLQAVFFLAGGKA